MLQGVPAWASHQSLSEKQYDHAVTELVWLQRKEESKVELIESLSSISVFRVLNEYDQALNYFHSIIFKFLRLGVFNGVLIKKDYSNDEGGLGTSSDVVK